MPRLTGTVKTDDRSVSGAYVQIRNLTGDFQGEVRTGAEGSFVLYPSPGRWKLVSWLPGTGSGEQEVEVGDRDLEIQISLS